MKILVTGGTGHLGRVVVENLKTDGHRVRILARHPGDDPTVEWISADLGHRPDFASAVEAVGAVIYAATHPPAAHRGSFRPPDFIRSPTDVDIDGPAPCSPRQRKRESSTSSTSPSSARAHGPDQPVLARVARADGSWACRRCRGRSSARPASTGRSSGCWRRWRGKPLLLSPA